MTSPDTQERECASTRAAAPAQLTADSHLTSLSPPSASDSPLSSLPSSYQTLPEHPKSPRDDPIAYGGHPKNKDRPYPLSLVPFDLSEPYEASEYLTIRSYDETCQGDYLGQPWANEYRDGVIDDEQMFDDSVFRRYLDRFIQENYNHMTRATKFFHQSNLKSTFYDRHDKEWAKLDLVDVYRRRTGKVLGVPSQSQDTSKSKKDGATTPDASLIGVVKDLSCSSGWKRTLYAVIELKWMKLATFLTGEAKRQNDEKSLRYLCQEGVFQTMWYVILGYAISGCIFGLSIVNEYFYRVVYLSRDSTPDIPVLALEADSEFLEKSRRHFGYLPDDYSVEELAELQDFWSSPPNCLISDRANATLNKEARYHLDATILLFLAHAAALPTQRFLNDLPLPFAHHVPVDATADSATDMRLKGLEVGRRRHSRRSTKRNKRTLADLYDEEKDEEDKPGDDKPPGKDNDGSHGGNSGPGGDNSRGGGSRLGGGSRPGGRGAGGGSSSRRAEAFDSRTSTAPQEFRRGLERLSAPKEMFHMKTSIMASLLSNDRARCSRAPSSVDSDSSGQLDSSFDTSFGSNKAGLILDDLRHDPPPIVNKPDPVDIDLEDIDPESGELTLAAFKDRLTMLGVRVKLVTRDQMGVLLARG
ncbi:hypothetical protein CNBI3740 [Cryptococcus deneoformans B-3501A]|uniref:hypothetical protein n=1 Tax=Cryptococcus deneoformans (strain B-3501A) TaxID=283643 RepID=UPI000042E306|nr:hypothetical protein CNBI3740 [Cryptococcus neoformans var. neoformans B-3501A]EAL18674.1 hypothetical protein CNBI3740 [Cryptococcus neoformans var. neoformans B-3501A]